jgi:hypothetical protein
VLARHWTEAGETESAIAQWSRAGNVAEARNAFREALEDYQQPLGLLNLLPQSSERDLRELELRQSVVMMFSVARGYGAHDMIEATEYAAALAEKSGNLAQLANWISARSFTAFASGDLRVASALADQALELAVRESSDIWPALKSTSPRRASFSTRSASDNSPGSAYWPLVTGALARGSWGAPKLPASEMLR